MTAGLTGSEVWAISCDAGMPVSIALQHGAGPDAIRGAMTRDGDEVPMSPIGAALDRIASDGEGP